MPQKKTDYQYKAKREMDEMSKTVYRENID